MNVCRELYERDKNALSDVMRLRFSPFVVSRGKGSLLYDAAGKEYIDFSSGWGVMNTGYCHPRVVEAVHRQMTKLSFSPTISAANPDSILLAERLSSLLPGAFSKKVWYGHSGSDANEFIAKMVPVATGRDRIITFTGSYHGQTLGSYGLSGHPAQSRFISGGNVLKLPYPHCYRCAFGRAREQCDIFCLNYIENYVFSSVVDPRQVGAVVIEAIQCDGGDVIPPTDFLKGIELLCKKHDILLIMDEVKIGFGRTGCMFGFEYQGIEPDAVVMAKPMASGLPLSAVVGRRELLDAAVGTHLFTTAGNPVACAAAIATLDVLEEEKLTEKAAHMGRYLLDKLSSLRNTFSEVGDVRGKGLVLGMELVRDRKTKEPFPELAALTVYRAYELGLIFYISGIHSNVLEFTPPLIINRGQVDKAVDIIGRALKDAVAGRVAHEKVREFAGWSS